MHCFLTNLQLYLLLLFSFSVVWLLPYLGWTAHQRRAKKTVSLLSPR